MICTSMNPFEFPTRRMRLIYLAWIFIPAVIYVFFEKFAWRVIPASRIHIESMGDAVFILILMLVCVIPLMSLSLLGWMLSNLICMRRGFEFFWSLVFGLSLQSLFLMVVLVGFDFSSDLFRTSPLWMFGSERFISYLKDPGFYLLLIIPQMSYILSILMISRNRNVSLFKMNLFSIGITLVVISVFWVLIRREVILY